MMRNDEWTDRLSDYVDGELDTATLGRLERHLLECEACRQVVADLRAIRDAAPHYAGASPDADLWPSIAEAIERKKEVRFPLAQTRRPSRRVAPWIWQVAAAIGFIGIGAGATWLALDGPLPFGSREAGPTTLIAAEQNDAALAAAAYQRAVDDLHQVLAEGRDRLEPETLQIIEDNLRVIDRAIAESEAALAADPANLELRTWIASHKRRKLDILRQAALAVGGDLSTS